MWGKHADSSLCWREDLADAAQPGCSGEDNSQGSSGAPGAVHCARELLLTNGVHFLRQRSVLSGSSLPGAAPAGQAGVVMTAESEGSKLQVST